jgi:hypothetical protein
MREGWVGEDYLILFDAGELEAVTVNYTFPGLLPGFKLLGLRSRDYFIVDDGAGNLFTVPTIPVHAEYLAPFQPPGVDQVWTVDERFSGRIKWYMKPLIFGGDPSSHENQAWITHEQHAQLVRYWNDMYRSLKANSH